MDNYRRAQRDRVLREKRGINEEQVLLFALGRKDFILPDIDTDASKMASKRQILDKMRKTKRREILTERRKMETLTESHSAASAELQKAILISLKKLGDLVPEIRRRNKDAILNKRRNISAELELEEVLQETPRQVTSSRSESLEAPKLQRAAAQKRIRNSRDWVVQCRRRLIYAKSIINGNGALRRSRSSAENISIPENKQLSVSPPNTSLDTDGPADGIDKTPYDTTDIPTQSLDDASLQISDPRELVHTDQPIDFSNLEFWKVLGKGNYGKVVLASDPVSEGLLAIKIMDKSSCEDLISTELEVLRMAAGCPYLMTMRAFRETPTEYEIAMDYMVGGDLFGHMKDSMMFNTKTIRLFAAEMVCGLQFLHERGVIHSDLKPENILLQDTGHIKISDFGLAAMNVFEGDIVEYTAGTKGYIAPEVMDGEGYNHLADSFSFGVILYMMTVGDWPFYTRGTMDEYHQSLYDDIPSFPPGICCHTMDIIKRLLCKTPSARSAITSSIRSHPFFYSIDWSDVESGRSDPPFPYYYQEY